MNILMMNVIAITNSHAVCPLWMDPNPPPTALQCIYVPR